MSADDIGVDVVIVADADDEHGVVVARAINQSGRSSLRLNLSDLRAVPQKASVGYFDVEIAGRWRRVSSRTAVWWFRVGTVKLDGFADDEAQLVRDEALYLLRGALFGAGARWVDDPFDIERAEDKIRQLATASALGLTIPEAVQTNDGAAIQKLLAAGPVVAKAVSPGSGIAPFVDEIRDEDVAGAADNPTLFERRISATADLRVVVISSKAWVWRRPRDPNTIDWRSQDPSGADFQQIESADLCRMAVRLTSALGLTMSVQDWLETEHGLTFLEVNPQGAWLFLSDSDAVVAPALAQHLLFGVQVAGEWPSVGRRFRSDFKTKAKAPGNDDIVAPVFVAPPWIDEVAGYPEALETARRAREAAEARVASTEEKASRLVQIALALLTISVGVATYQLSFALDRPWPRITSLIPVVLSLGSLILAAFEAMQIDRVGLYRAPRAEDLACLGSRSSAAAVLAIEEQGRRFADWTAQHKMTDLMQARAWFSRGLATLLVAALFAGVSRSLPSATARTIGQRRPASTVEAPSPEQGVRLPGAGLPNRGAANVSPTIEGMTEPSRPSTPAVDDGAE